MLITSRVAGPAKLVALAAGKFALGLLAIVFAASALVQLAPGFVTDER